MKGVDLTKLIEGLVVVILLAVAVGKFGALRGFAAREAAASLRGWDTHTFFPGAYRQLMSGNSKGRVHPKGAAHIGSPPRLVQPNLKQEH